MAYKTGSPEAFAHGDLMRRAAVAKRARVRLEAALIEVIAGARADRLTAEQRAELVRALEATCA